MHSKPSAQRVASKKIHTLSLQLVSPDGTDLSDLRGEGKSVFSPITACSVRHGVCRVFEVSRHREFAVKKAYKLLSGGEKKGDHNYSTFSLTVT